MQWNTHPFPVIGLTGGMAAGKSTLAALMAQHQWVVMDADQVARDVVAPGTAGLEAVVHRFGPGILQADGSLDRSALGQRVFQDPQARQDLESLLHPRIEAELQRRLEALPPDTPGVVLEAALWVEHGMARAFDELWVADAPESLRLQRICARDGLTEAAARARLKAQGDPAHKRQAADRVFLTDGRPLAAEVAEALKAFRARWRGPTKA